jgi:hypothetical protein
VSAGRLIEGSLNILTHGGEYLATFSPFAVEDWPPGRPLRLENEAAVERFLLDVGIRHFRIRMVMDDVRSTGRAFLPMVLLMADQRQSYHL